MPSNLEARCWFWFTTIPLPEIVLGPGCHQRKHKSTFLVGPKFMSIYNRSLLAMDRFFLPFLFVFFKRRGNPLVDSPLLARSTLYLQTHRLFLAVREKVYFFRDHTMTHYDLWARSWLVVVQSRLEKLKADLGYARSSSN